MSAAQHQTLVTGFWWVPSFPCLTSPFVVSSQLHHPGRPRALLQPAAVDPVSTLSFELELRIVDSYANRLLTVVISSVLFAVTASRRLYVLLATRTRLVFLGVSPLWCGRVCAVRRRLLEGVGAEYKALTIRGMKTALYRSVEKNIRSNGVRFQVTVHVRDEYKTVSGIKSIDEARRVKERMLQEQSDLRNPSKGKSPESNTLRIESGVVLKNRKYFATCSIDGKKQTSKAQLTIHDARAELQRMLVVQREAKERRYNTLYPNHKPKTEQQRQVRSADQKRYHESPKGIEARKMRSKANARIVKLRKDSSAASKAARKAAYSDLDRLVQRSRDRVYRLGKRGKARKLCKTIELIGCSRDEFRNHLTTQLYNGERLEDHTIDHIFPVNSWNLQIGEHMKRCFSSGNTQPLTATENFQKQDKLPTKAMAAKVNRDKWPPGITEDMLPDIYPGWATPLRMRAAPTQGASSSTDQVKVTDDASVSSSDDDDVSESSFDGDDVSESSSDDNDAPESSSDDDDAE